MRGIKINPTDRTITEVDVPNPNKSLQGLYGLIGCDLVQLVELDRGIILCCDEEGKLKPVTGAFTFFGNEDLVIAGNAVILGGDASRFGKLHENIASFEQIVEWVNPADVMSRFNTDCLCPACTEEEQAHPDYRKAADAEMNAVRHGDHNFPGIGWPGKDGRVK